MFHHARTWASVALTLTVVLLSLPVVFAQDAQPEPVGLRPDAPTYALHGPYWVGTMQLQAQTVSHPTVVTLWYPALNPSALEEGITYDWQGVTVVGHAIQDAAPDNSGGTYPLVIFSHGSNGAPTVAPYLMEHWASQGFVVMSIAYADNWVTPLPVEDFSSIFTRPQDVSWQIDYAESLTAKGGKLEGTINTDQIAVAGHSFGGETALLAAGAPIDFGPESWCDANPTTPSSPESGSANMCITGYPGAQESLADLAGLKSAPEGLWPSWGDSRVDAIVPISPGLTDFSTKSLAEVMVPTLVLVGTADHWVYSDWPLYKTFSFETIGSPVKSLVEFANGDHMLVVDTCDTMPWLIDMGAYFFCADPVWDMDRAHDLMNHFTTAFLLDVLKGDEDAHAALLAENVSFPGITYETTLK